MIHKLKNVVMVVFIFSVTLISACGSSQTITKEEEITGDSGAMGRYLEQEVDVSDSISFGIGLIKADNGSLLALDNEFTVLCSKDEGNTFEPYQTGWEVALADNQYTLNTALSKYGDLAVIYDETSDNSKEVSTEITPVYRLFRADGSEIALNLPSSSDEYADNMWFGKDGSLFASARDGSIYELNQEDGSAKVILELQERASYVAANEAYVVAVSGEGITLYERTTGKEIENEGLQTFVLQLVKQREETYYSYSDRFDLSIDIEVKEDNTYLYFFCKQGIYRHPIGGNLVEQVVDGRINSLGDPSFGIAGGIVTKDEGFLVLFFPGKLTTYAYDKNVPTVPDIQLSVYSLGDNPIVKQGIAMFQKAHPEAYVKLTIGMDGESVTREDAIKKLNTEILAGKGPDLLVLDNMPIDSYIQKGMLLDLTSYLDTISKEEAPLPNITNCFRTESGLFAIPLQFSIPLTVGAQEDIASLSNLNAMADGAEALRSRQPEGKLFGLLQPESLLERLLVVNAPSWSNEKGIPEEAAMLEYFTQAKRIWDAEQQGITEQMQAQYETLLEQYTESGVSEKEGLSNQATEFLLEHQSLAMELLSDPLDFAIASSVLLMDKEGNQDFSVYAGQSENVYYPKSILGINAKTANMEITQELLKTIMSSENLNMVFGILPNNEAALAYAYSGQSIIGEEKEESFGTFSLEKTDGETVMLPIYWPEAAMFEKLDGLIRKADTAYLKDEMLEESVTEEGIKVLEGEISPEEAVSLVLKKVSIYLSE